MDIRVNINLPRDKRGFTGRECPRCHQYFKVKFGTGLPTPICHCPYCGYTGDHNEFCTTAQIKYAEEVALKAIWQQMIESTLKEIEINLKQLEKATSGGFIQIRGRIESSPITLPLTYFQEKEVETYVTCDNCGAEFAVFGVFANCPDCGKLNASVIFKKSIEVCRNRLRLLNSIEDKALQEAILKDALSDGVAAFDALGKALRLRYPTIFPQRPKNLFQNLNALSNALLKSIGKSLSDIIGDGNFAFLFKMFQIRHIYEHNMGVVDDDFVNRLPDLRYLKGRKYPLERTEIENFLILLLGAGNCILAIVDIQNNLKW